MSDWDRNAARWGQNPAATRGAVVDQGLRAFMLGVYNNMLMGLVLTGIVAYGVSLLASTTDASQAAVTMRNGVMLTELGKALYFSPLRWVLFFGPVAFVMFFSYQVDKVSTSAARAMFLAYAALVGLSISSIVLIYAATSIANAFFITASAFAVLSVIGYTTKRDLGPMGSFLIMGTWGLFAAFAVNALFIHSSGMGFWLSALTVVVFAGLTAYDTQKMRETYYQVSGNSDAAAKVSVIGALELYIDFIAMFLAILRLTGSSRN